MEPVLYKVLFIIITFKSLMKQQNHETRVNIKLTACNKADFGGPFMAKNVPLERPFLFQNPTYMP